MNVFKIIPRTIFLEFFSVFLIVLSLGTLLLIVLGLTFEAKDQVAQVPFMKIPALILYILPFAFSITFQFVIVFTCAIVFSNLVHKFEIRTLAMCGISPWSVTYPVLFLALILSVGSYFLADLYLSWGITGMTKVVASCAETIIYTSLEKDHIVPVANSKNEVKILFTAREVHGKDIYALSGLSLDPGQNYFFSVSKAQLSIGPANKIIAPDENCIHIAPQNDYAPTTQEISVIKYLPDPMDQRTILKIQGTGFHIQYGKFHANFRGTLTGIIPLDQIYQLLHQGRAISPSDIPNSQLKDYENDYRYNIQLLRDDLALRSLDTILYQEVSGFGDSWDWMYDQIRDYEKNCRRARSEPLRRIATAANCFMFAWMAIPLTFFLANAFENLNVVYITLIQLALLVLLFALMQIIPSISKKTEVHPMIFMIPHILYFIAGLWISRWSFAYAYKGKS